MKIPFYISFFLSLVLSVTAQSPCDNLYPRAQAELNANAVKALVSSAGSLFMNASSDEETGLRIFDEEEGRDITTTFGAGIAIAGYRQGEIRSTLQRYGRFNGNIDFSAGPLSTGETDSITCRNWDKLWRVTRSDILLHLQEIAEHGAPLVQRTALYDYPAHKNPHFARLNGFDLPISIELAPFFDANQDAIYNPDDGDYPLPADVDPAAIPTELLWTVFNDISRKGRFSEFNPPLGVEVQLTAFAYDCPNEPLLHQSFFTQHKIINRSDAALDSLFVAGWMDFDLSCWNDDYFGSVPELNTSYVYNATDIEEEVTGDLICLNFNIPVQAVTMLNQEMTSMTMYFNPYRANPPGAITDPNSSEEIYNHLNGYWKTGEEITYDWYLGYAPNNDSLPASRFMFPDNPNDTIGWSMYKYYPGFLSIDYGSEILMSYQVGDLPRGAHTRLDQVWSYHRGENGNHLSNVDLMYEQIPRLQQFYDNGFADLPCLVSSAEVVDNQEIVEVYPNPTTSIITINAIDKRIKKIQLYNNYGRLLLAMADKEIDLTLFAMGIYYVKITLVNEQIIFKKVIKTH